MKSILFLVLLFSSFRLISQDLVVAESKDAYYLNGQKIKPKDLIRPKTKIEVKKKGNLSINYKSKWTIYFKKGTYDIDSTLKLEIIKPEFILHDSIYTILEKKGLQNCNFNYKIEHVPGTVHGDRYADDIRIKNDSRVSTNSDTVELAWTHPSDYSENYYLVIMNMFSEYIGLLEVRNNKVNLDLRPFKSQKAILYKLIALDCRESRENLISIE